MPSDAQRATAIVRIVLDTNVVVSGLLWSGSPSRLLEALRAGQASAFTSSALLDELADVLTREHLAPIFAKHNTTAELLVQGYTLLATAVPLATIQAVVVADPDDDVVIATAVAAHADLIVSGDRKVLALKHHQGIPILTPAECLRRIGS